jgi:hypothetical protein
MNCLYFRTMVSTHQTDMVSVDSLENLIRICRCISSSTAKPTPRHPRRRERKGGSIARESAERRGPLTTGIWPLRWHATTFEALLAELIVYRTFVPVAQDLKGFSYLQWESGGY